MNGVRIVALVMALAVTAMVGTVTAQESVEPEQQKEVREIIVEIAGDATSTENAEQLADMIREEVEASGGGHLEIYIEQIPEDVVETLGRTVTLEFVVQSRPETVSVMTVSPEFAVSAQWSRNVSSSGSGDGETVVEDNSIDVVGTIDVDDEDDTFLVTCWGSFAGAAQISKESDVEESTDEESESDREAVEEGMFVEFQASAMFRPNQTRVIASRGEDKLALTLVVDEDD